MSLALPQTLVAGTNENVNHVQANFDTLANQFPLAANSTNFAQVPQCRVTHSTTQSTSTGVTMTLAFDTETYDLGTPSNNMHDTATNNSRITFRVAGLYSLGGAVQFGTVASGSYFILSLLLNGATTIAESSHTSNSAAGERGEIQTEYRFSVNDYVELRLIQGIASGNQVSSFPVFYSSWRSP
jgi:hypothetical protein